MSDCISYEPNYGTLPERVKEGGANPLLELRIEVDGSDIKGAPSGEYYLDDYVGMHFVKLLDSIPTILAGERVAFEFYSHPQVLLLDPNDDSIDLACVSPERADEHSVEDAHTVCTEAFVREILQTVEELVDRVTTIRPELEDDETIRDLRQRADEVRSTL